MLRKILFQIHLWTGIGIGLYVVAICVTGSITRVPQRVLHLLQARDDVVARETERLSDEAIAEAAKQHYPGFEVSAGTGAQAEPYRLGGGLAEKGGYRAPSACSIHMTGADLGDAEPRATKIFEKVAEFHDNLLGDRVGREINGVGGAILAVMCLSGLVIWWPGIKGLRRGPAAAMENQLEAVQLGSAQRDGLLDVRLRLHVGDHRRLHGVSGSISGRRRFSAAAERRGSAPVRRRRPRVVRAGPHRTILPGLWVKILWGVVGLIPAILFVTGVIMWWNRKVRGWVRAEEGAYTTYLKTFFKGSV